MNQQNPNKQSNSSSGGYTNTFNTEQTNYQQAKAEEQKVNTGNSANNQTNSQANNQTNSHANSQAHNQAQEPKTNTNHQAQPQNVTAETKAPATPVVEEVVETEEQKLAKRHKVLETQFNHLLNNLKYVDYFDDKYEQNIKVLEQLINNLNEQELATKYNKHVLDCVLAIKQKYNKAKQSLADKSNDPNIVKVRENISTFKNTINNLKQTKSRLSSDKENVKKYSSEKLIKNAIKPFVQNFDNGLNQLIKFNRQNEGNQNLALFIEKLKTVKVSLFANLDKNNCKTFGQANDEFDPNIHDALGAVPIENVPGSKHNHIIQVSSQGFKLHDRVVVPAGVLVAIDYSKN